MPQFNLGLDLSGRSRLRPLKRHRVVSFGLGDDTYPAASSPAPTGDVYPTSPSQINPNWLPSLPNVDASSPNSDTVAGGMKKSLLIAAAQVAVAQMALSVGADIAIGAATTAAATATAAGAAALAAGATATSAALAAGSCVPIVGWAIAAVIAIGTYIGGEVAKRQTKKLIEDVKTKIAAYGNLINQQVQTQQLALATQQYPAALALATSGQALQGLGSFLGITKAGIIHAFSEAQTKSVQLVGDAILKTGAAGAKLVGDKRGEALAEKKQAAWDKNSQRVEVMFEGKLQNPYKMLAQDVDTIGRSVSGQQTVHVVRIKTTELYNASVRDMNAYRDKVFAAMQTPEYLQALTVNIAKAMRGDPTFSAQATQIDAQQKMLGNVFNSVQQKASTSGNAGGILAAGAAALGTFLFLRP